MVEEAMSGPQKFAIRITNDNFKVSSSEFPVYY